MNIFAHEPSNLRHIFLDLGHVRTDLATVKNTAILDLLLLVWALVKSDKIFKEKLWDFNPVEARMLFFQTLV